MAIVTAPGRFCYLECDETTCGRKIYQYHIEVVQEIARLSGWNKRGASWKCPACSERNGRARLGTPEKPAEGRADSASRGEMRPRGPGSKRRRPDRSPRST